MNNYEAFVVQQQVEISLDLNQTLKLFPGDILVKTEELNGYLLVDQNDIEKRFTIITNEG
jgi:hypothetical protein